MDTKNVHKSTEDVIGEVAHREISLGEIIRALRKKQAHNARACQCYRNKQRKYIQI